MIADPERRLITALFLGTALSISSVKIVAIVVRQMDFSRRNVGQVILASAIIDDTIGWIIIALTFGIAGTGVLEPWPVVLSIRARWSSWASPSPSGAASSRPPSASPTITSSGNCRLSRRSWSSWGRWR